MSDILCIGGPAHGKLASDAGMTLEVIDRDDIDFASLIVMPSLRHGPGYRRLPNYDFKPMQADLAKYIKRRLIDRGQVVTVYALADYADGPLIGTGDYPS